MTCSSLSHPLSLQVYVHRTQSVVQMVLVPSFHDSGTSHVLNTSSGEKSRGSVIMLPKTHPLFQVPPSIAMILGEMYCPQLVSHPHLRHLQPCCILFLSLQSDTLSKGHPLQPSIVRPIFQSKSHSKPQITISSIAHQHLYHFSNNIVISSVKHPYQVLSSNPIWPSSNQQD